jgi:putative transcriptional regulator
MFVYKIDILKALVEHGYNATKIRKDKILSQATMQNIRQGKGITTDTINTICLILRCQPSDVIEIIPTEEEKIKYFFDTDFSD